MARWIDADALKRRVQRVATEAWKLKLEAKVETTLNQFLDYVEQSPTIDAVSEWIPCSERLPKKDGRYLTTYPLIRDMKWVHILWYGEPSMPSRDVQGKVWYVSDEEYGDVPYDDVIAWMPLPKPYERGEDHEQVD